VRDLVERLYDEGLATVYVGDLTDVLDTHWSVRVNEKTHNFWAFKKFIHRLACVCESTASLSKPSRKRGRVRRVLSVATTRRRSVTATH